MRSVSSSTTKRRNCSPFRLTLSLEVNYCEMPPLITAYTRCFGTSCVNSSISLISTCNLRLRKTGMQVREFHMSYLKRPILHRSCGGGLVLQSYSPLDLNGKKTLFSTTPTPFSRKKKTVKVVSGGDDKALDSDPTLSFNYLATIGMLQVARAISPLVEMNVGFSLTSNQDLSIDVATLSLMKEPVQLELKTGNKGSYLFTIDRDLKRLNLVSPMSGIHTYSYDEEEQLWLSASTDRHDLRGMVTRDLLRHARGLAVF